MDGSRFDHLTRSLASGTSRRKVLKALLGLGGAAAVGSAATGGPADAARRPSPTPTPHKCPGVQTWNGTKCACPPNLSQCVPGVGPACCNDQLAQPGSPDYSECCDNACCHGTCYGEELCCPTGNTVCNARACCDAGQACCSVDDCCSGACYAGNQFCCAAGTGEICGDDCCDTATERCCERPGGPVCIPLDSCCLDRECPGDQTQCLRGVCNPQTNSCEQQSECTGDERCCPDQQPGDVGVCLGPNDCCAAFDCTNPPRDLACPVASCVANECHYEEMCDEDTFCCAGELCCPRAPGSGCCTLPDGSHTCVPECCDDTNCKNFEPGTCVRPRCDADGYCHYDNLCEDDQFCCADEICCPLESGWGCCTRPDGSHACVPECCDASNCKRPPDDCSTPICRDDGTCEYIGCPVGQVCGDGGVCQCADGSVICDGICAELECCGGDVSTCDPQRFFSDCVECIGGTCSAENTQFDPCTAFPGGWCDDGRCHQCIDNDFNPCELDLQCCSGTCSDETGRCIVPA